ncbi:MAG: ferrochelatase, partial [Polaromonas sp.]|nr:ferrochelatase [Polaromonas sp.]
RHAFTVSGGKYFHYIPCLNDNPVWISALSSITQKHLSGWTTQAADAAALQITQDEAMKAGAKQ